MSVRVMGDVWDLDIPGSQKLVLLALADHADHDGRNAHPSVRLLAQKTGFSERTIQYILRDLEEQGLIERTGDACGGRGHAAHYAIHARKGAMIAPFDPVKGEDVAPITGERVQTTTLKGANDDIPLKGVKEPSFNRSTPPTPSDQKTTKRRKGELTTWPEGFTLTDDLRAYAIKQGIRPDRVDEVWEVFRLRSEAKGYRYANWTAAWQTWVRNSYQDKDRIPVVPSLNGHASNGTVPVTEADRLRQRVAFLRGTEWRRHLQYFGTEGPKRRDEDLADAEAALAELGVTA